MNLRFSLSCNCNDSHTWESLWDVENRHSDYWLVENQFSLFHVHRDKIFIEYCHPFKIRFRKQLFHGLFTCFESDINTISDIFHSFSKYWNVHQFEKIFFKIVCCLCSKFCIHVYVWFQPSFFIEWNSADLWYYWRVISGHSGESLFNLPWFGLATSRRQVA